MLAFSLIGPSTGTARHDIYRGSSFSNYDRATIDTIWRLDQYTVDLTQSTWRLLKISRFFVDSTNQWLHWVGLYSPSPVRPDGRIGYYIGVGVFFDSSYDDVSPLFNLLTRALNNFEQFTSHYQNTPQGFSLSSMRLDRIGLSLEDMENLERFERPQHYERLRNPPTTTLQKLLPNLDINTLDVFSKLFHKSLSKESLDKFHEILATQSSSLFLQINTALDPKKNIVNTSSDIDDFSLPSRNTENIVTDKDIRKHTPGPTIVNGKSASPLHSTHNSIETTYNQHFALLNDAINTLGRNISLHTQQTTRQFTLLRKMSTLVIIILSCTVLTTFAAHFLHHGDGTSYFYRLAYPYFSSNTSQEPSNKSLSTNPSPSLKSPIIVPSSKVTNSAPVTHSPETISHDNLHINSSILFRKSQPERLLLTVNCQDKTTLNILRTIKDFKLHVSDPALSEYLAPLYQLCLPLDKNDTQLLKNTSDSKNTKSK